VIAPPSAASAVAVVTGANRGIGREVVRQLAQRGYQVVLGSRDLAKGETAAKEIAADNVRAHQLDVADAGSIARFAQQMADRFQAVDVLVNNAAILYDDWQSAEADLAVVEEALRTNLFGAWRLTQALLPLLRRSNHGRIVNVSSDSGSLASMGDREPAYRISKVALNALTRMLAAELRRDRILVNSVCPGFTATDMSGGAGRPVQDGAASVVWAATLPDDGPTGGFFRDGRALPCSRRGERFHRVARRARRGSAGRRGRDQAKHLIDGVSG
jgi:NAD(P)-dependent dehydrogenase (short-subunit alcohol dehydrogenase family)